LLLPGEDAILPFEMSALLDDTIAAIATAPGRGAVAMLRVSGPGAREVLHSVCSAIAPGEPPAPRTQRLLSLHHPETGERIDRALVTFFPAPHSFTGEDTIEISTHGGALTPQLVLDGLLAAGARMAERGEFTRRAVLNGKLDLLQAEAILDLIDGRSPALHRAAVDQMERGLSRRIEELRGAILQVEALVAYSIDFPEEDEPPVPPARIAAAAAEVSARIEALLATAPQGEMLREGALVVLAGRPNSGKSSLFNALLGSERAIVTEIPGTTRDALEAQLIVAGYPFRLVDTAGLRATDDRVEGLGIEVAHRYLRAAQVVLFCADADRPLDAEEREFIGGLSAGHLILVRTKADRIAKAAPDSIWIDGAAEHLVSSRTGAGLPELGQGLLQLAFAGVLAAEGETPLVTRERHARALRLAHAELASFLRGPDAGVPVEIASTHLRAAAIALEELIGAITPDDVLGRVFGDFCVGK
jgi:tRNA modification GTPase